MTTPLKLKIELNRRFIEIIYGRENLSELNYINVSNKHINCIDSITFKDLANLESLHLEHNEIENIDIKLFVGLSKLNSINLSFNSLKKLDPNTFIQLGNLENLYLIKVELEEINASLFTGLRSLKNLYLGGNKLEKIDAKTFSGLEKLCVLGLDWNRITVIDPKAFENLSALKNLSLNNNRLEGIDPKTFQGLNNLEFLDLSENKIESVDSKLFDGLSNLRSLYMSNNRLERIDGNTFKGLKQLDKLFLDKNYLEVIDIKLFKYLPKLSMLRLNNNALKEIDRKCFEPLEKSIDKLILYENNTNTRSFIRFSFVATLKDWQDKDKLHQHGFLTEWNDFLNQFPEKEKASSSSTTSTVKTASVASIITPISSNPDEIFVDPYVGKKFKNRYEVVEKLGQGQYGLVYLVNDTDIRVKKAMKIMDELDSSTPIELDILWENNHENIVRYFDHFHLKIGVDDKTFLITEYCEKGDLKKQIDLKKRRGENFSQEDILKWIYQATKALEYLHSRDPPIIHRDIKPANMLLTGKNEIRLADLGLAKLMFESHASSYAGSPAYMSPEVFKSLSENEIYYPNADVWSLGCVLYELVFLKYAFPNGQRENPEIPDNLSESGIFSAILPMMLDKDKKTRITSSKLIDEISKLLRR